MVSSALSRSSAVILFAGATTLLFASDVILPALVPGVPPSAAWLGQLIAAAWLGVAALDWLQRDAPLGGIYGRPTVLANLALYFISAASFFRALIDAKAPPILWAAFALTAALAIGYGALLLRGPFDEPQTTR